MKVAFTITPSRDLKYLIWSTHIYAEGLDSSNLTGRRKLNSSIFWSIKSQESTEQDCKNGHEDMTRNCFLWMIQTLIVLPEANLRGTKSTNIRKPTPIPSLNVESRGAVDQFRLKGVNIVSPGSKYDYAWLQIFVHITCKRYVDRYCR